MGSLPAPAPVDPGALRELHRFLAAVGYDEHGVAVTLGHPTYDSLLGSGLPAVLDTDAEAPLPVLVRLFATHMTVPADVVRTALPRGLPERLAECGLMTSTGGEVRAAVRLLPLDGLVLAADRAVDDTGAIPRDQVMAVAMSTKSIADVTVRRPVERVLDIGTGSGALALLAARHAGEVIGVDSNPRALQFAAFNAVLNGLDHVELRLGNGLEPVAGETFDLVVSNPPFVVSPEARYAFRDSGVPGDGFVEHLVRTVPGHLRPGGLFQMIGGWVDLAGRDSAERLREWGRGSGCAMWVVRTHSHSPREYAQAWTYDDTEQREGIVEGWERWLHEAGAATVSDGFVFIREGGTEWFRLDEMPQTFLPPAGESVLRVLDAGDALAALRGPGDLLDVALRPAAGVVLGAGAGAAGWEGGSLRVPDGFAWTARLEPPLLALIAAADGRRPVRHLLADYVVPRGGTVEAVAAAACAALWALVERGFVVPVPA